MVCSNSKDFDINKFSVLKLPRITFQISMTLPSSLRSLLNCFFTIVTTLAKVSIVLLQSFSVLWSNSSPCRYWIYVKVSQMISCRFFNFWRACRDESLSGLTLIRIFSSVVASSRRRYYCIHQIHGSQDTLLFLFQWTSLCIFFFPILKVIYHSWFICYQVCYFQEYYPSSTVVDYNSLVGRLNALLES